MLHEADLKEHQSQFQLWWVSECTENFETWADQSYVLCQIDMFWLSEERKGSTVAEACAQWSRFVVQDKALMPFISQVGANLVKLIEAQGLSYAEITHLLVTTRAFDSRWQLHSAREAENPANDA